MLQCYEKKGKKTKETWSDCSWCSWEYFWYFIGATIFNQHLEVETCIDDILRLGKEDSGKQRLLKVSIPSLAVKKSILRNSSKLKDVSDPAWMKNVFVTLDLTPKEQEQSKEFRKQLADLNSSGKKYWIKNGAIIRREGTWTHPFFWTVLTLLMIPICLILISILQLLIAILQIIFLLFQKLIYWYQVISEVYVLRKNHFLN